MFFGVVEDVGRRGDSIGCLARSEVAEGRPEAETIRDREASTSFNGSCLCLRSSSRSL